MQKKKYETFEMEIDIFRLTDIATEGYSNIGEVGKDYNDDDLFDDF